MRLVLDPNVLISAALSRTGAPARLVREWLRGSFELVISEALLAELRRALDYPKLRGLIRAEQADRLLSALRAGATLVADPDEPHELRSRDPHDDYLIALAAAQRAMLVTGDSDLLTLRDRAPIRSPREALETIAEIGSE
ncbi:MAG: putative toxin-antitoxin system toxin component, PIN family [Thermoanaerobaculia bacterium]